MADLDVEISLGYMIVELEGPWLHAELFLGHDLDASEGFPLSPGPERPYKIVSDDCVVDAEYAEFCSSPAALVVATRVQLNF